MALSFSALGGTTAKRTRGAACFSQATVSASPSRNDTRLDQSSAVRARWGLPYQSGRSHFRSGMAPKAGGAARPKSSRERWATSPKVVLTPVAILKV